MQNPPDSKQRSRIRRVFTGFAVLAMLGVLGVAVLRGSLWLEHRTEITLPKPTGQTRPTGRHSVSGWPTIQPESSSQAC